MCTNIIMNINPKKCCGTCKFMKIYLSNSDSYYCTNNKHESFSDRYFVNITYTCPYWENKSEK